MATHYVLRCSPGQDSVWAFLGGWKDSKNIKLKKKSCLWSAYYSKDRQKEKDLKIGQLDRCTINTSFKEAFSLNWMQYICCKERVTTGLHFQTWKQPDKQSVGHLPEELLTTLTGSSIGRRRNMGLGHCFRCRRPLRGWDRPHFHGSGRALRKEDLSWNTMAESPQNCLPGLELTQFNSWVLSSPSSIPSTVLRIRPGLYVDEFWLELNKPSISYLVKIWVPM